MATQQPPGATPLTVFVEGVGLLGPGMAGWPHGRACLDASTAFESARCVLPLPMALPSAERRRAGAVVKVSLAVAQEAVEASGLQARALPSVFSSSNGDAANCHEICSTLASNDRLISPTRFHNSVHNAASGYWSISSGAMASSSVLCARDASFAAGLLEAMTQAGVEDRAVLLVAYDTDYPEPMHAVRPVQDSFGVGLVLAPRRSSRSQACWVLDPATCFTDAAASALDNPALEQLRNSIPAARCLPLLRSVAIQGEGEIVLGYLQGVQLAVHVVPCRQ